MKKVIRLTESELKNIVENSVKRAILEGDINEYGFKDFGKDLGKGILGAGIGASAIAGNAYLHSDDPDIDPEQQEINQQIKRGLGDNVLEPQGDLPDKTIGWEKAVNHPYEAKIAKAVTESIKKLIKK